MLGAAILAPVLGLAGSAGATGQHGRPGHHGPSGPSGPTLGVERSFQRVATFFPDDNGSTVAEIVTATDDGMTLVYGDSVGQGIGVVDITDPAGPRPAGRVDLGGEVTSVAALGNDLVLAAVSRSESTAAPAGTLEVVSLDDLAAPPLASFDLGGQPDSIDVSADGRYAAIAIENERDEDVTVDGVEGGLPQLPAGGLVIVDLVGEPSQWTTRNVDLTGIADRFPEDPEPEFVAINGRNIVAVTLQENNHIVLVDLATGRIRSDFPAGSVTLEGVDATEDGVISLTDTITDVAREPDAIAWTPSGGLVTANEGDLDGGSRGFTVFDWDGDVTFDSGTSIDELAVRHGHYPESRSEAKGSEPEGVAVARYGHDDLVFVGNERGNFVAVYQYLSTGQPAVFRQFLPTGIAPEGLLAIPQRDLFVVADEASPDDGLASDIAIYQLQDGAPTYPMVVGGDDADGAPLPWGTLSGLVGDPNDADVLYGVPDNYYGRSRIFTLDVSAQPAVVTAATELTLDGEPVDLDLEGIAVRPQGGFWVVSEGTGAAPEVETTNQLVSVAADGTVEDVIELPAEVAALQASNGYEGVATFGEGDDEQVWVAFQRQWGGEAEVRLGRYTPATGQWAFARYALDGVESAAGGWVGLSELTALPDGRALVLERDNQRDRAAAIKRLYVVDLATVEPAATWDDAPTVDKELVLDLLPELGAMLPGVVPDKPEGVALAADGQLYVVTDNDGIEDALGLTLLLRLGQLDS